MRQGLVCAINSWLKNIAYETANEGSITNLRKESALIFTHLCGLHISLRDELLDSALVCLNTLYIFGNAIAKGRTHIHQRASINLTHSTCEHSLTLCISLCNVGVYIKVLSPKCVICLDEIGGVQYSCESLLILPQTLIYT